MQKPVRELVDAVGIVDAIEIIRRWGGRKWYCPQNVRPADPLALTLGYETAKRLVEKFGGQDLQLPIERNALIDLRNRAIFLDAQSGDSHEEIAIRYGIMRQRVPQIIKQERELAELRAKYGTPDRVGVALAGLQEADARQ